MLNAPRKTPPPDQVQREAALDPRRSVLVRAPAGSGKTTLLSQRFLSLLAEVEDPRQIVAITFTNAAAAEMRNRILDELRNGQPGPLALRALQCSHDRGWDLLNLPAQLRISTIDSFCRDLALQQPLLSGLGGCIDISEQPGELYLRAARRTLEHIGQANAALSAAIETLLEWRDNSWREIEDLTVQMLKNRDRWMKDFVLNAEQDWDRLRARLELSFQRSADSGCSQYSDAEWQIVRACFTLLRRAVAELRVVFAESGAADFTEIAQIALSVLKGEEGFATEAAAAVGDSIRHLLVDEFQDTSRRQHDLLRRLIAAWSDREGRTCFVVGDPMQSIYAFRDADAELFPRVEQIGFDIPDDQPLLFDSVHLTANFRTEPSLIEKINETFAQVFAANDGSGICFAASQPARANPEPPGLHLALPPPPRMSLHLDFVPGSQRNANPERKQQIAGECEAARQKQIDEIVAIIRSHLPAIGAARAAHQKFRVAVLGRARKSLQPIAAALREAQIQFRALDLENLNDRPEIIDALSLARALLNPQDRVAWLGLLRAPWCGLSLADLHTLTSADLPELLAQPVPQILSERAHLISLEARSALDRVLLAVAAADRLRSAQPTASLGTWLEQVWLQLGGAQCVDAQARVNLDLFWKSLDSLPQSEPDLFGSALSAALSDLKALPDPGATSDYGVQLMTIHGAKGLEFEVVIVPDLQVGAARSRHEMLSWLERGLLPGDTPSDSEPADAVTEFLIAPLQQKGSDSGRAKKWVDSQRRDREKQEARRLLYVAATRARDELHFFARPTYKTEMDGNCTLADPAESLLKTAWPAFEGEIRNRFIQWRAASQARELPGQGPAEESEGTIAAIAASGAETLLEMPPPGQPNQDKPTPLRRLPPGFVAPCSAHSASSDPLLGEHRLYERHEGGLLSRALGKAVHTLLQQLAGLLLSHSREAAIAALSLLEPRVAAEIRAVGVDPSQASHIAAQALQISLRAAAQPVGQWILSPQPDAASEVRWTGLINGRLRTVQVDRVFRSGSTPQSATQPQNSAWWIIDYKTAHENGDDAASTLLELRRTFAPQIEAYAEILRSLHGTSTPVFGGLYYPRMSLFDWWQL